MKKLSLFLFLCLLMSTNAYATKSFVLVCDGSYKITSGLSKDAGSIFEEWELTASKDKVWAAKLLNTDKWLHRKYYLPKNINLSSNIISITKYNTPSHDGYTIKKYEHNISLNSGRFSWYNELRGELTWIAKAKGTCSGYKELLRYLN